MGVRDCADDRSLEVMMPGVPGGPVLSVGAQCHLGTFADMVGNSVSGSMGGVGVLYGELLGKQE